MHKTKVLALAFLGISAFALAGCWPSKPADSGSVAWNVTADSGAVSTGTVDGTGTALTGTSAVTSQGFTAYVAEAMGAVSKKPASGRARPVTAGVTTLAAGDALATGDDGTASVTFSDGTTVRLAQKSKITFTAIGNDAADATLESGSLWARVLKPLGDGTLYTFRTADLSAGVRGTAVFLTTDSTGSQVEIHDSYSDSAADSGATIDLGSGSGTTQRHLAPRRRLLVPRFSPAAQTGSLAHTGSAGTGSAAPAVREEPLDKAAALSDDFKRVNTQKDLVLMSRMIKERQLPPAQRRKMEGELAQSMPSDAREALALVREHKLFAGSGPTGGAASATKSDGAPQPSQDELAGRMAKDQNTMMDRIEKDLAIGQLRDRFNRDAKREMADGSNKRDERIVENKRAMDDAINLILDPNMKSEQLRRDLPDSRPPLPGEQARPLDDGTLKGMLRELRPVDQKNVPKIPFERPLPPSDRDAPPAAQSGAPAIQPDPKRAELEKARLAELERARLAKLKAAEEAVRLAKEKAEAERLAKLKAASAEATAKPVISAEAAPR